VLIKYKGLTCIGCPLGCQVRVEMNDNEILKITGNGCKNGYIYAKKECTYPTRILTSTVRVKNGEQNMVSVKTKNDIPKEKIFECMALLKDIMLMAPIKMGDIILKDAAETGIDIIATENIKGNTDLT
jgi:CxxC motif-containing protein